MFSRAQGLSLVSLTVNPALDLSLDRRGCQSATVTVTQERVDSSSELDVVSADSTSNDDAAGCRITGYRVHLLDIDPPRRTHSQHYHLGTAVLFQPLYLYTSDSTRLLISSRKKFTPKIDCTRGRAIRLR